MIDVDIVFPDHTEMVPLALFRFFVIHAHASLLMVQETHADDLLTRQALDLAERLTIEGQRFK